MRIVILAGGLGTRLSEVTDVRPKPMIEVGGRPILWHILKGFGCQGLRHFVVALGYRGDMIKSFFLSYAALAGDLRIATADGKSESRVADRDDWIVDLVDTGLLTNTGGRVKRLAPWLPDERFGLTYGDGVSDIDFNKLLDFHRSHGRLVTVTAVRPPARFGALELDGDKVIEFSEKSHVSEGWINGGFMIVERSVLSMIRGDDTNLERDVLEELAADGELMAYRHDSYWQCMDTMRDVRLLNGLWDAGEAPWKTW